MSGLFVVVTKSRVKPGKAEEYSAWLEKFCDLVEEREPRILAFHAYADEDGALSTVVQVHPDAESMEFHFRAMGDQLKDMFEYLDEVVSVELFGTPSETVLKGLSRYQDILSVAPVHVAGVTRLG
jgi:quinol monooxygenase YgiN